MKSLPKQVTRTMYVTYQTSPYISDDKRITLMPFDSSKLDHCDDVCLGSIEVTFDVPQADITGAQVAKLRRRRDELVARATAEADQIDRQIQELLALPAPGGDQ